MTLSDADRQMRDSVDRLAETIETHDGGPSELLDEIDPLDVHAEITGDGRISEITLTVATGGPHIEIELFNGMVRGYWAGSEMRSHVDETIGLQQLQDRYELALDGVEVEA